MLGLALQVGAQIPGQHSLTVPRSNMERALIACWFTELEPYSLIGSLYPPPQWQWDPLYGRNERAVGFLMIGWSRFIQCKRFVPYGTHHHDMQDPFWSCVVFDSWVRDVMANSNEPATIEALVKAWAVGRGWESSAEAEAYWQRARRFVF